MDFSDTIDSIIINSNRKLYEFATEHLNSDKSLNDEQKIRLLTKISANYIYDISNILIESNGPYNAKKAILTLYNNNIKAFMSR